MKLTVNELAAQVAGQVEGDGTLAISGVASLRDAAPGDLSFLSNPRYAAQVEGSRASAVVVANTWQGSHSATLIRVANPDAAFARLAPLFAPPPVVHAPGIHPTAVIAEGVELGAAIHIGAYAVIGQGCQIGAGTVIEAHVVVGENCRIGSACHLFPHVSLRERTLLGDRVRIHNGTVIGSDGYGYNVSANPDGSPLVEKIPQLGAVTIGNDVEIGANVTIDRARFGFTRIGNGVKIDNLVQIAHNVQIGDYSGIISQVGISGSSRIGSGVIVWGQAGLAGHLEVGDGAQILAQAGVTKDVPAGAMIVGSPAVDRREAIKVFGLVRTVERLTRRVEELEQQLKQAQKVE